MIGSYHTFLWRLSHGNIWKNISISLCMRQSKPALYLNQNIIHLLKWKKTVVRKKQPQSKYPSCAKAMRGLQKFLKGRLSHSLLLLSYFPLWGPPDRNQGKRNANSASEQYPQRWDHPLRSDLLHLWRVKHLALWNSPSQKEGWRDEQTDMGDFNREAWIEKGKQTDHDTVILGRRKQHGKAFTGAF